MLRSKPRPLCLYAWHAGHNVIMGAPLSPPVSVDFCDQQRNWSQFLLPTQSVCLFLITDIPIATSPYLHEMVEFSRTRFSDSKKVSTTNKMKGLIWNWIRLEVDLMSQILGKSHHKAWKPDNSCHKHLATKGRHKSLLNRFPSRDSEENKIYGLLNV